MRRPGKIRIIGDVSLLSILIVGLLLFAAALFAAAAVWSAVADAPWESTETINTDAIDEESARRELRCEAALELRNRIAEGYEVESSLRGGTSHYVDNDALEQAEREIVTYC